MNVNEKTEKNKEIESILSHFFVQFKAWKKKYFDTLREYSKQSDNLTIDDIKKKIDSL